MNARSIAEIVKEITVEVIVEASAEGDHIIDVEGE